MGALLSTGLCVSFGIAALAPRFGLDALVAFADPLILACISLAMAPLPVSSMVKAGRDILKIAPQDLDQRVRRIADAIAARHGFAAAHSYVARSGRAQFIEIGLVGASSSTMVSLGQLDRIREEVAAAMGDFIPDTG